jgi:diphthamide synthase (EF-2-diphthine--ammonia ligase)
VEVRREDSFISCWLVRCMVARLPGKFPTRLQASLRWQHPLVLDSPSGPQTQKFDPVKLREEAEELATLAQSVQKDVSQVVQGKLPKEIGDKLKRIEKLAKHLGAELVR